MGAAGTCFNLTYNKSLNHKIDVIGGILEDKNTALLKNFFKQRRSAF
jgi:tRNA(Arg) A34 adenosine deaminase TadA